MRSVHQAFSSGFMNPAYMSFTVIPWRANGGTTVGKGCVFEVTSPGTSLAGNGTFLDWPQRLSRDPVEHIEETILRGQRHRIHGLTVVLHGYQLRGGI